VPHPVFIDGAGGMNQDEATQALRCVVKEIPTRRIDHPGQDAGNPGQVTDRVGEDLLVLQSEFDQGLGRPEGAGAECAFLTLGTGVEAEERAVPELPADRVEDSLNRPSKPNRTANTRGASSRSVPG
jgi:hypothetical protein